MIIDEENGRWKMGNEKKPNCTNEVVILEKNSIKPNGMTLDKMFATEKDRSGNPHSLRLLPVTS